MEYLNKNIEFSLSFLPESDIKILKNYFGFKTNFDILHHFPFRYINKTKLTEQINFQNEDYAVLHGKISNIQIINNNDKNSRLTAKFDSHIKNIYVELNWFKGVKWLEKIIKPNVNCLIFGKVKFFNNKLTISHPEINFYKNEFEYKEFFKLEPVYSIPEKCIKLKFHSLKFSQIQKKNLINALPEIEEIFLEEDLIKYNLFDRKKTYLNIHFPQDDFFLDKSIFRLKFEELLFNQLKILGRNKNKTSKIAGNICNINSDDYNKFILKNIPFELTNSQKKVLNEIHKDMSSGYQLNRLLQGDVGSGKTVVALLSIYIALQNGFQACFVVPTEILARQHFLNISNLLKNENIVIEILIGGLTQKNKTKIKNRLKNGEINILISTHAVFEEDVIFSNLGIAVIDEQHRFGVLQRFKMWKKNIIPPHILVMTATPIPRTLAMTLYGDLEVSTISELPKGRKPIKTYHKYYSVRSKVNYFIEEQIKLGRQVYIVFPIIEESEHFNYQNLLEGYQNTYNHFNPKGIKIGMIHGRQNNNEREAEMEKFIKNETKILVSTTVIEVGIDVSNATVMVIESAEKFGLSQLHQLRGRVGRGAEESYCILLTDYNLNENAKIRLKTMTENIDGFKIAEIDLKLRGPGDIEGIKQSGVLDFNLADLVKDEEILQKANELAKKILNLSIEDIKIKYKKLINWMKTAEKRSVKLKNIS